MRTPRAAGGMLCLLTLCRGLAIAEPGPPPGAASSAQPPAALLESTAGAAAPADSDGSSGGKCTSICSATGTGGQAGEGMPSPRMKLSVPGVDSVAAPQLSLPQPFSQPLLLKARQPQVARHCAARESMSQGPEEGG